MRQAQVNGTEKWRSLKSHVGWFQRPLFPSGPALLAHQLQQHLALTYRTAQLLLPLLTALLHLCPMQSHV